MARIITQKDKETAKRLKALYLAKRHELELTQTKIADMVDMKQGAVAQYFNGHIALNYEAVIKFAKALQTDPWNIDPSLHVISDAKPDVEKEVVVPVNDALPNKTKPRHTSTTIRYDGMTKQLHGYDINSDDYAPFLREGDIAIVDGSLQPEPGDDVVLKFNDGHATVGEMIECDAQRVSIKTHDAGAKLTVELAELLRYDAIVSVKKQKKNRTRRIGPVSLNV